MISRPGNERVRTIEAARDRVAGSDPVDSRFTDRRLAREFVGRTLRRPDRGGRMRGAREPGVDASRRGAGRRFASRIGSA